VDDRLDDNHRDSLRFVLVVPAFNEDEAIAGTLRRALAARAQVRAQTPVTDMTVVVVNDGSTDRTQEIVERPEFADVVKVRFLENRGYGAAIKAGFRAAAGELVGFIDADGTCDPGFSVRLINRLLETEADVVLASRLNADSKMPPVRRLGNRIFAKLLNALAGSAAVDVASGFRVLRRTSLRLMSPLPNGMHFTPAMSCICVLDPRLRIEEVPMPYEERIGRSKLSVLWDGLRFLSTILFSFCCYSPVKSSLAAGLVLAAFYGLIFAVLTLAGSSSSLLAPLAIASAVLCVLLVWAGVVVHQLNYLLIGPRRCLRPAEQRLQALLHDKGLVAVGAAFAGLASVAFGLLGLWAPALDGLSGTLATSGLSLVAVAGMAMLTCGLVTRVIWSVSEKQKALVSEDYEPLGAMEIWKPGAAVPSTLAPGERSSLAS
jgi:hypothetical protein